MYFYMFPPFSLVGEVIVKSVQEENHSHNYYTKLAIPTLVPSNISTLPSHSGTVDQTAEMKPLSDTNHQHCIL